MARRPGSIAAQRSMAAVPMLKRTGTPTTAGGAGRRSRGRGGWYSMAVSSIGWDHDPTILQCSDANRRGAAEGRPPRMTETTLPHRPNVGIALFNAAGLVFAGTAVNAGPEVVTADHAWQMPQGGIDPDEDIAAAARRELWEETGIADVSVLAITEEWWPYDFPPYGGRPHKLSAFPRPDAALGGAALRGRRERHRPHEPAAGLRGGVHLLGLGAAGLAARPGDAAQARQLPQGAGGLRALRRRVGRPGGPGQDSSRRLFATRTGRVKSATSSTWAE